MSVLLYSGKAANESRVKSVSTSFPMNSFVQSSFGSLIPATSGSSSIAGVTAQSITSDSPDYALAGATMSIITPDDDTVFLIDYVNGTPLPGTAYDLFNSDTVDASSSTLGVVICVEVKNGSQALFKIKGRESVGGDGVNGADTLQKSYNGGNTILAGNGEITFTTPAASNSRTLVIVQNDATNNPNALVVTNAGTGKDIVTTNAEIRKDGGIQVSYVRSILPTGDGHSCVSVQIGDAGSASVAVDISNAGTGKDISGTGATWGVTKVGGISGATLNLSGILEFADNAAALGGGLVIGDLYRTADVLKIVHA